MGADTPGANPPSGWYSDPYGRYEFRYWNGQAWSEHVMSDGQQSLDLHGLMGSSVGTDSAKPLSKQASSDPGLIGSSPGGLATSPRMGSPSERRLTRRTDGKILAGVANGLGAYFNIDPLVFRIAFVLLGLFEGVGVLLYLFAWALVRPDTGDKPAVEAIIERARRASGPARALLSGWGSR